MWDGIAKFVGMVYDVADLQGVFAGGDGQYDKKKVLSEKPFKEHAGNLQRQYCLEFIHWLKDERRDVAVTRNTVSKELQRLKTMQLVDYHLHCPKLDIHDSQRMFLFCFRRYR
jgi:6-pyruvoyl-tetrahydropterin synthase